MTFSIFVAVNSYTFNNRANNIHRTPFKPNPIQHYRQTITGESSRSSRNTHIVGRQNGVPGGTSKGVIKTSEDAAALDCANLGIVQKIVIPKSEHILSLSDPETCGSSSCKSAEEVARTRVRQSNTTMTERYFSRGIGYLQNRNKTDERKTSNMLDREESILLYGSYDKQKFFLRNSHTTGSLAACAVSYYKPNNNQFAVQGSVGSSSLTGRKKYNVDNLCRTRVPKNEFFSGISYNINRKRHLRKVCCDKPSTKLVTYENVQSVVTQTTANISILRDIINDGDATVALGDVVQTGNGQYQVPITINNINLSQLDETETVNLLTFMRTQFANNGMVPETDVIFIGTDGLDYNNQFTRTGTGFYVDPSSLRITRLTDVLNSPAAYIEKTNHVRVNAVEKTTIVEMELDLGNGTDDDLTPNQIELLKVYLTNLYYVRYGVKYSAIEIMG